MRKKMRAGKAGVGEHAEREKTPADFKTTSSPIGASATSVATSETASINC
jgi:hypothetical protein